MNEQARASDIASARTAPGRMAGSAPPQRIASADEHAMPEHVRKVRTALRQGRYSTDQLVDAALDRMLSELPRG
jgi:hypothetical protein